MNIDQTIKQNIVSILFSGICLGLYFFFPINDSNFEIFVGAIIFLFLMPILYTRLILHKSLESIGFSTLHIDLKSVLFMATSVVLGGLLSFVIISVGWGVESYVQVLSKAIFVDFKAFLIYEGLFSSLMLFLFIFFTWGFVYSIDCKKKIVIYSISFMVFCIFLLSFYTNIWVALPLLVPIFFIPFIRDGKNIIYLFLVVFFINLILDTLVIKTFI